MLSWFTRNWFLAGLLLAVGLSFVFPEAGARGGFLRTEWTTKLAVAVLFFVRGTLLPLGELRRGLLSWRLHLLVHAYIFLILPVGVLLVMEVMSIFWAIDPNLRLGFIFLSALPTTISTAAVFTSMAGGNTAGSVFNATLSNCLGVFIVPLWVAWVLQQEAVQVPLGFIISQIVMLVIVPLILGQAVKPFLGVFPVRHRKGLEIFSSTLILFVLFASFADSVQTGLWQKYGWKTLLGGFGASLMFFTLATLTAHMGARVAGLSRSDYICLIFCGPQKTLASGVTIANVIFAGDPALSLILLPVLFYHFIQLFAGGFMVTSLAKQKEE